MKRQEFLSTISIITSTFIFPISFPDLITKSEKPNILFILTDDQRWDAISCMGNKILMTPHIDRLAREGTLFEQAFVTTSICMASRASIMTGVFERRHGCNFHSGDLHPSIFAMSYPVLLRQSGYYTGFIGKMGFVVSKEKVKHSWNQLESFGNKEFDWWRGFPGQGEYFPTEANGKHLTKIIATQSIKFLNSCPSNKPFCLSISFKAPHAPFTPDPSYRNYYKNVTIPSPVTTDKKYFKRLPSCVQKIMQNGAVYDFAKQWFSTPELYQKTVKDYYRLIMGVDEAIGEIREHLKKLKYDENTIIIFSSDNGFLMTEHGLVGKALLYEESIRVPLIIYDPRVPKSARGQRRNELVLNIDIAPTILSAAGVEIPEFMQGKNLMPLVWGEKIKWRKEIFCENLYKHKLRPYPLCEAVRTKRWKYICYSDQKPIVEELFDLKNDPLEIENLVNNKKYRQTLKSLRKRRDELLQQAKGK